MSTPAYNQEALHKRHVYIYTEATPNPDSMKFMLNFILVGDNANFDFANPESAARSPLASGLFAFPFITRVFFMNNFITVTKKQDTDWYEVVPRLKQYITEFFDQEKPVFDESQPAFEVINNQIPDVVKKIQSVLEEYIQPAVEMDGGAIQLHSFNETDGILKVSLQGSCSGCPSSTITLKAGIENLMKKMVPEVKQVVAEGV